MYALKFTIIIVWLFLPHVVTPTDMLHSAPVSLQIHLDVGQGRECPLPVGSLECICDVHCLNSFSVSYVLEGIESRYWEW